MDTTNKMVSPEVAQRVLNLYSTADYIKVLADIVNAEIFDLREAVEKHGACVAADTTAWGQIETLLNLLGEQGHTVATVAEAFEAEVSEVAA